VIASVGTVLATAAFIVAMYFVSKAAREMRDLTKKVRNEIDEMSRRKDKLLDRARVYQRWIVYLVPAIWEIMRRRR
jgi:hypothetical protein